MKLYLYGHDYKYAVEQMLLTMFPEERPEYPEDRTEGERMEISLSVSEHFTTAVCRLYRGENRFIGRAAASNDRMPDRLHKDRICQRLIKNAIYRAALNSGKKRPPWGALTGVRPGKLMAPLLSANGDEKAVRLFQQEYDVSEARARLCLDTSKETLKAIDSLQQKDVCLYIGIPFCPTRCAYCSFVSQSVEKSMKLIPLFLDALDREVDALSEQIRANELNIVSIYFGGGTPTTLSAPQLDHLISHLESAMDLSHIREFTVEAGRPDTITRPKLEVLKKHKVDRVSVNPQTMSDKVLNTIGRKHSAQDILDALAMVREVGGMAVNMDLIAGLPDDTVESFSATIEQVLQLRPENLTVHTLSLKKGSRIMMEGSVIPSAEAVGEMLDIAMEGLRANGYAPYYLYRQKFMSGGFENVGWTLPGYVNLYNICIMEEICSILAMGGGGSSKLIGAGDTRNIRLMEPKYPLEYINSIEKVCSDKEKITEFLRSEEK